jgi:hypothetical protein
VQGVALAETGKELITEATASYKDWDYVPNTAFVGTYHAQNMVDTKGCTFAYREPVLV